MNKIERVQAALRGEKPDRVPFSFWRHFVGDDAQGEACVRGHREFLQKTDVDFVKVMHDGFTAPCSLEARTVDDLKAFRARGRDNPYVAGYVERCKRVVDELAGNGRTVGECPVYCNVFTAMTLLRRIGDERLAALIHEDRKAVRHAMDVMSEDIALMSELVIREAGCMGVFMALQGAERGRFDDDTFDELVRPFDIKVLNAANAASPWNILHFCAWDGIPNHIERWREYSGCAINWDTHIENMTLAQGREYFGGRPVLGGFNNRRGSLLWTGNRQQVMDETHRLVDEYSAQTGGNSGLIIGGDCSYLPDFDLDRFTWVRDALMDR